MHRRFPWIIAASLSIVVYFLFCQSVFGADNPIKLRRYSLSEGLSQGTVSAIVQDREGFIWVGTQDGLNRFDGYGFKVFRNVPDDNRSISSDYIRSLFVDESGTLWVGSTKGLNRYDPLTESFVRYTLGSETREHMTTQYIADMVQAGQNQLWIATMGGLFLFDVNQGVIANYNHQAQDPETISSDRIYDILLADSGILWAATDDGLSRFDTKTKKAKSYHHDPANPTSISGNNISALATDNQGTLWVATYSHGLNRFDTEKEQVIRHYYNNMHDYYSLGHDRVRSLLIDKQDQLWVGTRGGISLLDKKHDRFIVYRNDPTNPYSLSNDHIWAMFEDDNDSIWFATGDGINQFVKNTQVFGHSHKTAKPGIGISHKRVRSLHKTPQNELWVGVDNGLNRYDRDAGLYQYFQHDPTDPQTISRGMVMSILVDSKQRTWAGTYDGGLNLLLPSGKFKRFEAKDDTSNDLSHNRVYSIMEDSQGKIWVGTLQGLNVLNPQTDEFQYYFHNPGNPDTLGHDSIYDTIEGMDNDIWVATRNAGLNRIDLKTGKVERFEHDPANSNSISHNRVFALYQRDPDQLWLATSNGLNLLHVQQRRFESFTKEQGLLNNTIYAVTGDNDGFIWVSTNRGIARFDPVNRKFKTYTYSHGLQSNEFNNGAFFRADDGELMFGGINGFNRFYPDKIIANPQPPKTVINQFYLANKNPGLKSDNPDSPLTQVANHTRSIELNHKQSIFSFEFTALHFISPSDNRYAYKLEGFNEDWTHTDSDLRRATYTNLPAGDYTFKVKAANSDGFWNETPTTVDLTILPAPWFTWWAYTLYSLIIGSTICAFAWQRWQKQKAIRESEKRLSLALWGSGNEFWDWNFASNNLVRSNNSGEFTLPSGIAYSLDKFQAVVHPDDFNALKQAFEQHQRGETDYFECAYRLRNKKDQWCWVLDRGQIVKRDERGEPLRALGTVQNIDDLKTIEAELRLLNEDLEDRVERRTTELNQTVQSLALANAQLKETQEQLVEAEKMSALSGLVSGIAHEINTPIGICITSASVLSSASYKFFDLQQNQKLTLNDFVRFKETCAESLQLITSNLEKTDYLVQSFKMVSIHQSTDPVTHCDIARVFAQVTQTRQEELLDKQIELTFDHEAELSIISHTRSLELLFEQLLDNSLKHGFNNADGGSITLTMRGEGDFVHIVYRDSGIGLTANGREKLFDPFYTTGRGKGHLGLGMHIVFNHVTQRLGGSIEVDTSASKGLTYHIRLPLKL